VGITGLNKKHRCGKNSAGAKLCLGPTFPGGSNHDYPVTMPMVRRGLTGIHADQWA
jgi:hypothetical protein